MAQRIPRVALSRRTATASLRNIERPGGTEKGSLPGTNPPEVGLRSGSIILLLLVLALIWTGGVSARAAGFQAAPGSPFPTGGVESDFLAAADFNGDGKQDLAVVNYKNADVSVLIGDGHGGFSPAAGSPFPTGGTNPGPIATGDFNGDGRQDAAVVNNTSISILLGDGHGALGLAPGSPFSLDSRIVSAIAVGFFNADSHLDVVAAYPNYGVLVLPGDGSGRLTSSLAETRVGTDSAVLGLVSGDFNHDGNLDVAAGVAALVKPQGEFHGGVASLLGDGQGHLSEAPGSPFDIGTFGLWEIAAGDFNNDGNPDLAILSGSPTSRLGLMFGNADGSFSAALSGPLELSEYLSPVVGDFDRDGQLDVVGVGTDLAVSLFQVDGQGGLSPAPGSPFPTAQPPAGRLGRTAVADFDGDGRPDLAVAGGPNDDVYVLLNRFGAGPALPESKPRTGGSSGQAPCSSSSRFVRMSRRGVVRVRVTCSAPMAGKLILKSVTAKRKKVHRFHLGSKLFSVAAGQAVIKVKLSKKGRWAVRRAGRLKAYAVIEVKSKVAAANTRPITIVAA